MINVCVRPEDEIYHVIAITGGKNLVFANPKSLQKIKTP